MADNKIKFGLKNVYYALLTDEATPTYGTPIAIAGAVTFSAEPDGDLMKFYADDMAYAVAASNNGYNGTLEMARFPDSVLAALLQWDVDANSALVEISTAQPNAFALLFEVDGDDHGRRTVFYKCMASRPKTEHKTKGDKVEPATDTLTIAILPITIDNATVVKATLDRPSNTARYDGWYDAVTLPNAVDLS